MKVLYLGPHSPLVDYIAREDEVTRMEDPITDSDADFIVSYGYRHILSPELCKKFFGRAVNLHIGYLPWNRGAHPNYWSHAEGTPSGVTIHYLEAGLDKGDIAVQETCSFSDDDTLRTSCAKLHRTMEALFRRNWYDIRNGNSFVRRTKQVGAGSYHRVADLPKLSWDTPISAVRDGKMIAGDVFA